MYVCMCDAKRTGAKGACAGSRAALEANSTVPEFNLQDNSRCLPLSRPCKSNLRRHYTTVIGSCGLSKLISQLMEKLLTSKTAPQ